MGSHERRLELYLLLESLSAYLKGAREVDGAIRYALRTARDFFHADAGCIAVLPPGAEAAEPAFEIPARRDWDLGLLADFIRSRHPEVPRETLPAPVRRRRRAWGVLALARAGGFERGDGHGLARIAAALSETIERIDRERLLEVRSRIDRKIMEELRPKDLFYQILDGLRSLTRYDHSSALLIRRPDAGDLRLEAEQIAWRKGKSHRIGLRIPLPAEVLAVLQRGEVYGFERAGETWTERQGRRGEELARLLDYNRPAAPGGGPAAPDARAGDPPPDVRESAMLCAALGAAEGPFGILKIAFRHREGFGAYEAELLESFRSQAAVAIRNSLRTESLQARMLQAERKNAMADLARGVSHDVNNALGTALPIVQQAREDLREGRVEPEALARDLDRVHDALQLCRRVFGGMLSFARTAARTSSEADVRRAVQSALAILEDGLEARGIRVVLEVPGDLPPVRGGQSDLDRVFFNLINNAREAVPAGGRLTVRARTEGRGVEILVEDTGRGIPPEDLPRVLEPFFTTKPEGNGLGLSICRSLVWQMGGDMTIESEVGRGTRVRIRVPQAGPGHGGGA
jgi:signal transduction histidine kinase